MTYHVLASSEGYQQRGRASWYGRKFHGRRTSSGETFDMHKISAAHRTLPLPTFVEVTNLNNGKRLVVRVNDRGPFHDDRIIDLSYAAAVKLGFAEQGTAAVEVRALNIYHAGNDTPTDTDPNRRGLGPDALEPTWLQVGAFSEQKGALAVHLRLRREGFDPVTIVTKHVQDRVIHRVRLGPFHSESALKNQAKRLIDVGFDPPVRVSLACRPEEITC
jgi:rare lipoprotein A